MMVHPISTNRRRIPYGMMNFADIRRDNAYYVDKTTYIPLIEEADRFFFFIRPRRFGKSLMINMLRHYYDVNERANFEELFGGLYIAEHPTADRNTYLVLSINFSGIVGDINGYKDGLDAHCNGQFESFCNRYAHLLPAGTKDELGKLRNAVEQLDFLCRICAEHGLKIYLFIDEYDHFTNDILASKDNLDYYTNETHGDGYMRILFNKIKDGTSTCLKRCFITGVSPVTLDDLTSGFNIGTNYSMAEDFNGMMGFTEQEVREMLTYYSDKAPFHHSVDELIEIMKPWYDNYCFAQECYGNTTMYNANMVLYFVKNYIRAGRLPNPMIEDNIRTDYNKLRMLVLRDKEFEADSSIIQKIVNDGYITGTLKRGFPAMAMKNPDNFVSLMYYFGMLTIGGIHKGLTKLIIPNMVVREQIYTYLLNAYSQVNICNEEWKRTQLAQGLAYDGDWKPYFDYIAECLHQYPSQRDKQKGESFVHGFSLAMVSLNPFYTPMSELDTQNGYVDLFLEPRLDSYTDMQHCYIVELKYSKLKDPESDVADKRLEAIAQANRYAASELVKRKMRTTQLHKIVVVYKGMDMVVCEEVE